MDNGNTSNPNVPPDIVWNEDDPPVIFACSQHTEHIPQCNGECDSITTISETQVNLMNEGRAWARAGMQFNGIPVGMAGSGIPIELVDLLIWLETIKELLYELDLVEEFEFEEKYRTKKLEMMNRIRTKVEDQIKRQRVASSLGIIERPPILGPDGNPIG